MATTDIIKFYSGTKADLSDATDTIANCIGLQTDTNKLFWKINGNTKIYLQAAWADINNKPQYLSDSFLVNAIQDALSDALSQLDTAALLNQDIEILSSQVTVTGQGTQRKFIYQTGKKALPCWIQGTSLHNIQPQSVSIVSADGTLNLQLSRYLAYQNINSANLEVFPSGWKLCYR